MEFYGDLIHRKRVCNMDNAPIYGDIYYFSLLLVLSFPLGPINCAKSSSMIHGIPNSVYCVAIHEFNSNTSKN